MKCPKCNSDCGREEVHNGVAMLYGPYGCACGWSENEEYDLSTGKDPVDERGGVIDQYGSYHPPGSARAFDTLFMDWLQEQIVDTIYLDDGRTIDVRGNDVRKAIRRAMDTLSVADADEKGGA